MMPEPEYSLSKDLERLRDYDQKGEKNAEKREILT